MNTIKLNTIGTPCKAEGGGNSGGGSASSWRYFDARANGQIGLAARDISMMVNCEGDAVGGKAIIQTAAIVNSDSGLAIYGFAFDGSAKINFGGQTMTINDMYSQLGGQLESLGCVEITESEFYNLG